MKSAMRKHLKFCLQSLLLSLNVACLTQIALEGAGISLRFQPTGCDGSLQKPPHFAQKCTPRIRQGPCHREEGATLGKAWGRSSQL